MHRAGRIRQELAQFSCRYPVSIDGSIRTVFSLSFVAWTLAGAFLFIIFTKATLHRSSTLKNIFVKRNVFER
jgi:hypothetical protein